MNSRAIPEKHGSGCRLPTKDFELKTALKVGDFKVGLRT